MSSHFRQALRSKKAEQAFGYGLATAIDERNLRQGLVAMYRCALDNGALSDAIAGLVTDYLNARK